MQYFIMRECEFTDNARKENYVFTIFAVLITLYINSQLNGFHKSNGFHYHRSSKYTRNISKEKRFLKARHIVA